MKKHWITYWVWASGWTGGYIVGKHDGKWEWIGLAIGVGGYALFGHLTSKTSPSKESENNETT